jgi:hypothetical protein
MKKLIFGTLALLLAAGGACLAQSAQPSLGELAKQRRDEKKTAKVFTNEDVATYHPPDASENSRPAASPSASAGASASTGGQDKTGTKKDSAGKDAVVKEAAAGKDSPEVAELKQKLSSYREQEEGWKKSAKRYQDLLATETSDFRRQMYQDALQGDQQNIQLFQDKIDQAQADLAKAEKNSSAH